MTALIVVKDLRTYFYTDDGVVKAVDGISYDVRKGETVALVGESGCGKSVSALSVMRLVPPPGRTVGGEVLFGGSDLMQKRERAMRAIRGKEIAMVFQDPMVSLNPVLTIGRQITEALELHMRMTRKAALRRAAELLQVVGISDAESRLDAYPHQFSGGMRQRAMIAMAISCDPRLLIADEPTTNLDVTVQAQILELMKDLTTRLGTALLLITHNLGVVARYADRVNIIYAGKMVEQGPCDELFESPEHPYTLGLLRSVPRLDMSRSRELSSIPGVPPDPRNLPRGCAFQPRCPSAMPVCAERIPPLSRLRDERWVACWLHEKADVLPQGEALYADNE